MERAGHAHAVVTFENNPSVVRRVKCEPVLALPAFRRHDDLEIARMAAGDPFHESLRGRLLLRGVVFGFWDGVPSAAGAAGADAEDDRRDSKQREAVEGAVV